MCSVCKTLVSDHECSLRVGNAGGGGVRSGFIRMCVLLVHRCVFVCFSDGKKREGGWGSKGILIYFYCQRLKKGAQREMKAEVCMKGLFPW